MYKYNNTHKHTYIHTYIRIYTYSTFFSIKGFPDLTLDIQFFDSLSDTEIDRLLVLLDSMAQHVPTITTTIPSTITTTSSSSYYRSSSSSSSSSYYSSSVSVPSRMLCCSLEYKLVLISIYFFHLICLGEDEYYRIQTLLASSDGRYHHNHLGILVFGLSLVMYVCMYVCMYV